MPSNDLVSRLVISFVAGAPWDVSVAISQFPLVVHDILIIYGPLPVLRLILVDQSLVKLSVSPLVVQVVHLRLMVSSPVEGVIL